MVAKQKKDIDTKKEECNKLQENFAKIAEKKIEIGSLDENIKEAVRQAEEKYQFILKEKLVEKEKEHVKLQEKLKYYETEYHKIKEEYEKKNNAISSFGDQMLQMIENNADKQKWGLFEQIKAATKQVKTFEDSWQILSRAIIDIIILDKSEIIIEAKKVRNKGSKIIASVLKFPTNLQKLTLIECGIKKDGGIFLGNALENNKTLKYLNLGDYSQKPLFNWGNWNIIEDEGVNSISNALKTNNVLEELHLCHQNATFQSLNYLATDILSYYAGINKTLKFLDISYNLSYTKEFFSHLRGDITLDLMGIEENH